MDSHAKKLPNMDFVWQNPNPVAGAHTVVGAFEHYVDFLLAFGENVDIKLAHQL